MNLQRFHLKFQFSIISLYYIFHFYMGNQLASAVGHCCQPSHHEEVQMNSVKIERNHPKIDIILVNSNSDKKTQAKLPSTPENSAQNFESTASTIIDSRVPRMSAFGKEMTLKIDDVNIPMIEQGKMKVPFSVIKLTLSDQLNKVMNRHCEQMVGRFMEESNTSAPWMLTRKGYYVSRISKTFVSLFTENTFYEGEVEHDGFQGFIPHNDGILVTEEGIYKGVFQGGLAHGKGTFIQSNTKTTFKGEWRDGVFIGGIIENEIIKYIGEMKEGQAEGKGKLTFKKDDVEYVGQFKAGRYEGEACVLRCPRYSYEGCFKGGKKCGRGRITQKQQKIDMKIGSTRIKKYRPQCCMSGEWQNDSLISIITQE